MKTVTYECDRCKKSVLHPKEQIWNIGIGMECEPQMAHHVHNYRAQWCRKCVEDCRMVPSSDRKRQLPEPAPTLEDMIREIIQEEVAND